jgi:hypothetical protein
MKTAVLTLFTVILSFTILGQCVITSQPLSQNVCQNTAASPLTVSVDNPNASYQWYSNTINSNSGGTPISGATSNSYTPTTSNANTTYYYCVISGCNNISSDVAELLVNPTPYIISSSNGGMVICGSGLFETQIQTNVPSYLQYGIIYCSVLNGAAMYPQTSSSLSIFQNISFFVQGNGHIAGSGNYTPCDGNLLLTPISEFGCIGYQQQGISIFVSNPLFMPSLNNIEICSGESINVILNNSDGTTYIWGAQSNNNVIGESSSQNTNIINDVLINTTSVNQVVTYTVTPYSPNNTAFCSNNQGQPTSFTVTVKPVPTLNVSDVTICSGASTQLIGNGTPIGGTYLWSGTGLTSPANQQSQVTVSPSNTTSYAVSYTKNGCTVNDNIVVSVIQNPSASVNSQTICNGNSATLTASPSGATYSWSDGNNIIGTSQSITVTPNQTSNYFVSTSVGGCPVTTAVSTVTVIVSQIPIFDFHVNLSPCGTSSDTIEAYVNIPGGVLSTTELSGHQVNNGGQTWWYADQNIPNLEQYITFTYTLDGCSYSDSVYVDSDRNFILDEVIDTTIHACQGVAIFELPNNDFWDDSELNYNYEYIDQSSSSNSDFLHFNINSYANSTLNIVGYTATANGCLVDSINLNIGEYLWSQYLDNNFLQWCGENNIEINGILMSDADSVRWISYSNEGYFDDANDISTIFHLYNTETPYTYVTLETYYNHCLWPDTIGLQIQYGNIVMTGNDSTICAFSPIEINSTGVNSSIWNSGNIDGDIVVLDSGNYQFIVTGYSGYNNFCVSSDTLNVLVHPNPQVEAGQDISICEGETVTLNATGVSNINWSNGVSNNTSFIPLSSQEIIVTGIDGNNCSNSDTLNIIVNPNPQVDAGQDVSVCEGDSVILQGAGAQTLQWSNGVIDGIDFVPNQTETFVLNGIDINGCTDSDSITVSIYPHLDTTITESSIGNFTWSANGQTYSESGVYTAIIQNQFGCDSTITLNLTISTGSLSQISNQAEINIYPNPNNGTFEIIIGDVYLNSSYEIYSSDGKELSNGFITQQKEKIILPATFVNGVYMIRINNEVLRLSIVR